MARGGRRTGKPGAGYSNRSDLNTHLPVTTVPGQPYGQAGQQAAAQQAVPMGSPSVPSPQAAQTPYASPADVMGLDAPSQRPGEPITHGLAVGAGPGPEALNTPTAPDPVLKGLAILNVLGDRLPPELKQVQAYLQAAQQNQIPQ